MRGVIARATAAGRDVQGLRIEVREHRPRPGAQHGQGREGGGQGRGDDLVARLRRPAPPARAGWPPCRWRPRPRAARPSACASSRSKASPSGPRMNQPESSTRASAASISGRRARTWALKSHEGDGVPPLRGNAPCARGSTRWCAPAPRAGGTRGCQPSVLPDLGGVARRSRRCRSASARAGTGAGVYEPCPAISIIIFTRSSSDIGASPPRLKTCPSAASDGPRPQERVHHVVHVVEVPLLRAVAEDLDLLAEHDLAHEPADEALPAVADELARPVGVGEAQRRGADAVHGVVDEVVELAGDLVDAVHVRGVQQVVLVHGQALRLAVDLARARVDDLHARGCACAPPPGSRAGCGS